MTDDGDKVTEAVTEVDWTATSKSSAIAPGQFQEFTIEAGPLPQATSLSFGVVQTYSDKTVVQWNEVPAPGSTAEPDHPKPVLTLAADDPATAGCRRELEQHDRTDGARDHRPGRCGRRAGRGRGRQGTTQGRN